MFNRTSFTQEAKGLLLFCSVFLMGAYLALKPIILPPFDGIPGDYGDTRLIISLLEHSYLYVFSDQTNSFWSPNWLFYPYENTIAFSDPMIGNLPFYAIFRLMDMSPYSSYQAWFVLMCFLNFLSAWILSKELDGTPIQSSIVAFLFAFGMPRLAQFNHGQLLPSFLGVISIWAMIRFFKHEKGNTKYLFMAAITAAWQFWAGVYFGFFIALIYLAALITALSLREFRAITIHRLKQHKGAISLATLVALLILAPMAVAYLDITKITGFRSWNTVFKGQPDWTHFLIPMQETSWYRWLYDLVRANCCKSAMEPYLFPGFIALASPLAAFWLWKRKSAHLTQAQRQYLKISLLMFSILFLMTIKISPKELSPFYYIYKYVPGFGALRQLGRIYLFLILFFGLFLQFLLTYLKQIKPRLAAITGPVILALIMLESMPSRHYTFSKSAHDRRVEKLASIIKSQVQKYQCESFYLSTRQPSFVTHNDAMWLSILSNIPTMNGYSGYEPPKWGLSDPRKTTQQDIEAFLSSLENPGLDAKKVCLIMAKI